jgi:hypothetical protein
MDNDSRLKTLRAVHPYMDQFSRASACSVRILAFYLQLLDTLSQPAQSKQVPEGVQRFLEKHNLGNVPDFHQNVLRLLAREVKETTGSLKEFDNGVEAYSRLHSEKNPYSQRLTLWTDHLPPSIGPNRYTSSGWIA